MLTNPKYPFKTRLRLDVKAAGRWQTAQGGGLHAAGVGTGLTGFGGTLMVLDDPVKDREQADSELYREHAWSWYQEVFLTRLQRNGVVVVMGTRWHEDDIIGRIRNSAGASDWTTLTVPYLAEPHDVLGRAIGEPLMLFGKPPSVEKGEISAYSFAALYQQHPTPMAGGLFKRADFKRYATLPPDRIDEAGRIYSGPWHVIMTVDSAWNEGVGHDFSVVATWATDGRDFYLLNIWRRQVEFPDLKAAIREQFTGQRWRPRAIFVEDKANGRPLVQELRRTGMPVVPRIPVGSKIARADAVTPWFQSGHVYIPEASWAPQWIEEHASFPNGTYDDQVDTTSAALKELAMINANTMGDIPVRRRERPDRDPLVFGPPSRRIGTLGGLNG